MSETTTETKTNTAYERVVAKLDKYREAIEVQLGGRMEPHTRVYDTAKAELMTVLLELTGEGVELGVEPPRPRKAKLVDAEDFKKGFV